jgi:hypothetical protein
MRERFVQRKNDVVDPSRTFEKLLRTIWQNYCDGKKPQSFVLDIKDIEASQE